MNRELFQSTDACDPRSDQTTDWQNDLLAELAAAMDLIRNSVGGSQEGAQTVERVGRFLGYGPEPRMSPLITDEDVQFLFKQDGGAKWAFKPDEPDDECR